MLFLTMTIWVKRVNIISNHLLVLDKKHRNRALLKQITSDMIKHLLPIYLKLSLTKVLIKMLPLLPSHNMFSLQGRE